MNVLVIGSGGREHALVWKLAQSRGISRLFCAPGNPGIAAQAECVPLSATDIRGLCNFAVERGVDLTVVGPEQPLAAGIVDLFEATGLTIFGPSREAARLEWSKAFAKDFMRRNDIPTAGYRTFSPGQQAGAAAYVGGLPGRVVLKADGLAAGKGVVVCNSSAEALPLLGEMMTGRAFGASGETIIVEEFLDGVEASVFAVCDGADYVLLVPAQDHKRAFDGDQGKNTGGMGAYAPAPVVTEFMLREVAQRIVDPTLRGMRAEGCPFKGCLYVGLMLTPSGPKVVEYNCRFGDPETQVVLPLYDGDLLDLLYAAATGALRHTGTGPEQPPSSGAAVCVVLTSGGYPDAYQTGRKISGLDDAALLPGVLVFHAGTEQRGGVLTTSGGRVLGVTAVSSDGDLEKALAVVYEAVGKVSFDGMHFRRDIAKKALRSSRPSVEGGT